MDKHQNGLIFQQQYHKAVLGPLLFLIYINHSPDGLTSKSKLFADDTSLFSKINDLDKSRKKYLFLGCSLG